MTSRPTWWGWRLELTPHVLRRMADRGFSEVDLRLMMSEAQDVMRNREPGRWVVLTKHDGRTWEVIVEPDATDRCLVVITAYSVNDR